MKILYIDYDDPKNPFANGGQAHTTSELTKRLGRGHHITVVTGNYPGSKSVEKGRTKFVRLGLGNFGFMVSLLSHWVLLPIYVFLKQHRYDIIMECLTGPFGASLTFLTARKPLVAITHFFDAKKMAEKYKLPFDFIQRKLIVGYGRFIVLTNELAKKIKILNRRATIFIVPGGVGEELVGSKPVDGQYGLYIGRIDIYNKGIDLLIDAWKNIDARLVIAGSGQEMQVKNMEAMINKHGLSDKISFIGRVDGKAKTDLYRKSKFVIQPSRYETFGYVALEAIAAGKQLVCFDINGFKWIPGHLSLKIKVVSSASLAAGIIRAVKVKSREEIVRQRKEFAQEYTWDRIAREYERIMKTYV